jgi:transposase
MKESRPCVREQLLLLPQNMYDWLPAEHLARFVMDTVDMLDLSMFYGDYSDKGGRRPYDSSMMVALLLYGYCLGVRSSRKIERATWTDVAFRVIAAGQHPDHDTVAEFRKRHAQRLEGLFTQILDMAKETGLLKMGQVSIDGTKIRANASASKRMSKEKLEAEQERLRAIVRQMFKEADEVDAAEDELYGKGVRGDELPEHLRTQEGRLKALQKAKAALEARKKNSEQEQPTKERKNDQQVNTTDPDSCMMRQRSKIFNECYNAQAAVDTSSKVIVAQLVTQEGNDKRMFTPVMRQIKTNTQRLPNSALVDNGYFNEEQMTDSEFKDVQILCPPAKSTNRKQGLFSKQMQELLDTRAGRRIYKRRQSSVEPVFGQIKHNRGFRQFFLRGLSNVEAEWSLICTTHNLLKLWTNRQRLMAIG